jgi:pimeloyl-ACP methyl ester carboxylesterase
MSSAMSREAGDLGADEAARRSPLFFTRPPIYFDRLPAGAREENLMVCSQDGAYSRGVLYALGGERSVVMITHPRGDLTQHYLVPALLEAGYAVCAFMNRWPVTDTDSVHEMIVVDMAAWVGAMRSRDYERVVWLGNSGGGSISALYQWQAEAAPGQRLTTTAAGDPFDLNGFELPPADGLIIVAAPISEGSVVLRSLDPSVTDEADPLSCDPDLDMYASRNGYREPPQSSTYSAEFVERYRAAQLARSRKLDARARQLLEDQRRYQRQQADPAFARLTLDERSYIARRATAAPYLVIYRTEASLAYCDLSIWPSKRVVGSLISRNPQLLNYARGGFGYVMTPRGWLSVWSGTSTRSSSLLALPRIKAPTLVINFTGDEGVYPHDARDMLAASAAGDKQLKEIDATHFGFPLEGGGDPDPRASVGRLLRDWLRERFPAR